MVAPWLVPQNTVHYPGGEGQGGAGQSARVWGGCHPVRLDGARLGAGQSPGGRPRGQGQVADQLQLLTPGQVAAARRPRLPRQGHALAGRHQGPPCGEEPLVEGRVRLQHGQHREGQCEGGRPGEGWVG